MESLEKWVQEKVGYLVLFWDKYPTIQGYFHLMAQ